MTDMSFENKFIDMAKKIAEKSGGRIVLKPEGNSFRLYDGQNPIGRTMEIYAIFAEEYGWETAEKMFRKECSA